MVLRLRFLFLLAVLGLQSCKMSVALECPQNELMCGDGLKCIKTKNLCDFTPDCDDSSDELNMEFCKILNEHEDSCSKGRVLCSSQSRYDYDCLELKHACLSGDCLYDDDRVLCQEIRGDHLRPTKRESNRISEEFNNTISFIRETLKSSLKENSSCPIFFEPFRNTCYSLFTPLQVKWQEARLFCHSITGQLTTIKDIFEYKDALDFLKENDIHSNFWLGGFYNDTRSEVNQPEHWIWEDGNQIEMGSPFWSITYRTSNSRKCDSIFKEQLPRNESRHQRCVAALEENFYFFSDEPCGMRLSPFCQADPNN